MAKDQDQPLERKPDNTVVEQADGFVFPAWGIHVAKHTTVMVPAYKPLLDENDEPQFNESGDQIMQKVGEKEKTVPVCASVDEAKQHVLEAHGIDVDNDVPPPPKSEE